jgi:sigma-B regulation protein RsbU (phosphoserine phosphatase)
MDLIAKTTTLKVLVADDDPATRFLMRAAITKWGYDVVEASDGEETWTLLQQPDAPRLLIIDWLMPKLDGLKLCERIREKLSTHPYIILVTQIIGTENVIKGLDAGADEFLSKPINIAELHSRLGVGAKIIRYENQLAEQNQQLQDNIEKMKRLSALVYSASTQINTVINSGNTIDDIREHLKNMQRIQGMQKSLEEIMLLINSSDKK